MKNKQILSGFIFLFLFLSFQAKAGDNILQIVGGETAVNTTKNIVINMTNADDIVAIQIDIPIPDQIDYVNSSAVLNADRVVDHEINASLLESGVLRIFAYSPTNTPFLSNDGAIISFDLNALSLPGTYQLNFQNAVLGDDQLNNVISNTINGQLIVLGPDIATNVESLDFDRVPLLGHHDLYMQVENQGNTILNISDIIFSSSYFEVIGSSQFSVSAGGSQSLQIRFNSVQKANYTETMSILSNDADESEIVIDLSAIAFAVNELHTGSISAFSGDVVSLVFTMNNMEPIVGLQFDINMPDELTYIENSIGLTDRKLDHSVSANMLDAHILRIVAYSANNEWFLNADGDILELDFLVDGTGGYYNISIDNVILADTSGQNGVSDFSNGSLQVAAADIAAASSLQFQNVVINTIAQENLIVNNYGNDTLKIEGLWFADPQFYSTQELPMLILPGQSGSLEIQFLSSIEGAQTSTMRIFSNDPDESPYNIALSAYSFIPNYLIVKDSVYAYGDTMFVEIMVENQEAFTGFQFDLSYTEMIECITEDIVLSERANNHSFAVNELGGNSIRVLAYSMSQNEFSGNEGSILSLPFVCTQEFHGAIPLELSNAILGNAQSEDILWEVHNDNIYVGYRDYINLSAGWNMISTYLEFNNRNMMNLLDPLIEGSNLIKILNEEGGFIQNLPGIGWINTIGDFELTEGYYIKVAAEDSLMFMGMKIPLPFSIPLSEGYNMISYPVDSEQDALLVLNDLIQAGKLEKVMDESGGFIQDIPEMGWMNTIGNLKPGEGYYIKVSNDCDIVFEENSGKIATDVKRIHEGQNWKRSATGNPYLPMHIISTFKDSLQLMPGDELGVFVDDLCIGSTLIDEPGSYVITYLNTNDPLTEEKEGGDYGDELIIKLIHKGVEYELQELNSGPEELVYESLSTKVFKFTADGLGIDAESKEEFYVSEPIPNPTKDDTRLYISSKVSGKMSMELVDINGRTIRKMDPINILAKSQSIDIDIQRIPSGLYFIRIEIQHSEGIQQINRKLMIRE